MALAPRRVARERRLVHEVGQIGAREAGRVLRDVSEVDVLADRFALGVHFEDREPRGALGAIDHHTPIEPTRAQERGVEDVRAVRRREDDGEIVAAEAIHLRKELVQRLLAFVVPAAEPGAPRATDGVDLVDEDDRRRDLLGLGEELAHPRGAHADEQLDELGAAHRKERNARLSRHSAGQECLARTRRANEQDAPRDLAAQALEAGGLAQKIDDLPQVLLGGLEAGNVVECNLDRALLLEAMRALLEQPSEGPAARQHLLRIAGEDEPRADDQHPRQTAIRI